MTKSRTLQVEQEHHRKAFELYYAQGGKRSYARLAEAMKVSVATAKLWARSFDWRKRIGEREATVARQVADEAISSAQQTQTRNRKLIELATSRLAKAMLNGQIKYQLADLDRLIRLQSFLDSEANKTGGRTPEEMLDQFMDYYATLDVDERRRLIERARYRDDQVTSGRRPGWQQPAPQRALPGPVDGSQPPDPDGIPK